MNEGLKEEYHVNKSGHVYPKFLSVDEMVKYVITVNANTKPRGGQTLEDDMVEHITRFLPDLLLFSLQQKTNIPSKYDIQFINILMHEPYLSVETKDILEIYKNRKE